MKQSRSRRSIALLATFAIIASTAPASSQQPAQPDIAGAWRFKSSLYYGDCTLSGKITIKPGDKTGVMPCDFVVESTCRNKAAGLYDYWRVKQQCSAKRSGDTVKISSRVVRVEKATSNGVPYSPKESASYSADSFEVVLAKNGAQMTGHTVGGYANKAVTFWREVEAVS